MTGQPEVVAAADLSPVSPKPINLSSPIAVPVLQDQADILSSNMSLSSNNPTGPNQAILAEIVVKAPAPDGNQLDTDMQDPADPATQDDDQDDSGGLEAELAAMLEQESAEDVDDYAKDFDSPEQMPEEERGDVSQVNEPANNTDASDILTVPTATGAEPEDFSATYTQPQNETPFATEPIADTIIAVADPTSVGTTAQEPFLPNGADPTAAISNTAEATTTAATSDIQDPQAMSAGVHTESADPGDEIEIQALVDNITAGADGVDVPQGTAVVDEPTTSLPTASISSLPPRPPVSQQPAPSLAGAEFLGTTQPAASLPAIPPSLPSAPYSYGAPGTIPDLPSKYPAGLNVAQSATSPALPQLPPTSNIAINDAQPSESGQEYDTFLQEERKYVSEAKWDRFPEGSRLFIGNLSSERVNKKEVFQIFSKHGRLAQISLKTAYGFVQYYTVAEGQSAMDNLQGIEIKGRKIHLEISRTQKKDGDGGDRQRGQRGSRGGNNSERDRADGRRRDDYRPRNDSPGRGSHHRPESYSRSDRGNHWDPTYDSRGGRRSRSPPIYGADNYRRRSPSPRRRGPATEADLDIPRRYAAEVPDLQLLLLQEVDRDFVDWVQRSFTDRGVKVAVMFLNPRFPRDLVIQRQIVEGVHAVSELDFRAQQAAKIPLQVFDRSAGRHNVRFDQYQDLDPSVAAQLVLRTKGQAQMQQPPAYGNGQYQPSPYQAAPQPYAGQAPQQAGAPNLGALSGLDPATLQRVLAAAVGSAPQGAMPAQYPGNGPGPNAMRTAYGAPGAVMPQPHPQQQQQQQQHPGYPSGPHINAPPASGNPGESAQHVQNIMAQLARYRQ